MGINAVSGRIEGASFSETIMSATRLIMAPFGLGVLVFGSCVVYSQNYPSRPIRILTSEPGGSNDFAARLIAQGFSDSFGQPVIVDNRPAGNIPAGIVSQALPDGHTLLVTGSTFWIGPLMRNTPYDPVRDFSPITLSTSSPNFVAANPSVPAKSIKELIALAKVRPGELNYASGPGGSTNHLAAELFKSMARINIVRITYKGTGQAVNELISGQVQIMFLSLVGAMQHVKSGKLRALAVTSAEPTALFPDLPTVAASGLPGYENTNTSGMFAPAKTSEAIINRINQETVRVLNRVDVKEKLFNAGSEVVGSTPAQLAVAVKAQMSTMGKLIKEAGIRLE